jgi:membrane associated rhomboid family serine protease/Zn-finger nucleic acid-binding protein
MSFSYVGQKFSIPRMLKCPRCRYPLHPLDNGRAVLDHCEVCRGSFVEPRAMADSFSYESPPAYWVKEHLAEEKGPTSLVCPVDGALLLAYDLTWDKRHVTVDVCPSCHGLWLDEAEGGQLAEVISLYQKARSKAENPGAKEYLFQLLSNFPTEEWNPVRKRPVLVYGLMAALTAIHLLVFVASGGERALRFALVPARFFAGEQPWALLTHAFLHGGFGHLLGNLYFLWIFGDNVEDRLGHRGFLVVYLAAAVAGGLAHAAVDPGSIVPMLGASGAISGVTAAYLVLFPRVRLFVVLLFVRFRVRVLWYFAAWTAIQVVLALWNVPGVAWLAHLGGFGAGLTVGALYRCRLSRA